MGDLSTISKGGKKTNQLRTNIPQSIIKQLNLKDKDLLDWQLIGEIKEKKITVTATSSTEKEMPTKGKRQN